MRWTLILTVVTALVLAAGIAAVAALGGSDSGAVAGPTAPGVAEASMASPDQTASFSVLASTRSASDAPPAAADRFITVGIGRRFGANGDLARLGAAVGNTSRVYLVPGNGSVCTVVAAPVGVGGGCVPDDDAAAGHLIASDSWQTDASSPEHVLVSGAVHDGVDAVTVNTAAGKTVNVAVRRNVYAAELIGDVPTTVAWTEPDGSSHVEPIPYQAG